MEEIQKKIREMQLEREEYASKQTDISSPTYIKKMIEYEEKINSLVDEMGAICEKSRT